MEIVNEMRLDFRSCPENEALARMVISAFIMPVNPTLEQLGDVKTAVSEAVTNAIIHGYQGEVHTITIEGELEGDLLTLRVRDEGVGIADIGQAMEPLYTSRPELERSGMGFLFMEAFMDEVLVESEPGKGTCVTLRKRIGRGKD